MRRLILLVTALVLSISTLSAQTLPGESGKNPALRADYFPHRQYTFVWRNWSVVDKVKLAEVMGTSVEKVEDIACSMGLPRTQTIEKEWATPRGYITVVRRNWHLLPYDQLLQLLGMSREELKFRLVEDDFLFDKLGKVKPLCEPLHYTEPTTEMRARAKEIAKEISVFGKNGFVPQEPRFEFMRQFEVLKAASTLKTTSQNNFDLKIAFPYFSDFGDPLLDPEMGAYPEEMFRQLAEVGVNGIWLHTVLRNLVEPDEKGFPGDEGAKKRIEGLQRLVNRAAKYGVRIFLYMNEPRSMDPEWFASTEERQAYGGVIVNGKQGFCPSNPEVLKWLTRSLNSVFSQVEGLGGVFTITASENYTVCTSRYKHYKKCPHCGKGSYALLQAAVNRAIEEGVHSASPKAEVIVWDWKWPDHECKEIIENLPKGCRFMSVSEWSKPIDRGGVKSAINEYSMSAVGPGPRAVRNWGYARAAGLKCMAKVQVNSTWEMAITPSIPALDLVARHAENLSKEGVEGVFLSWSLGGYPSENLKLFQTFDGKMSADEAVAKLACEEYGTKAGALVREAWRECSKGFEEYPYHINVIYFGPHHMGPSNIFYTAPTKYRSALAGNPYDDIERWRQIYPIEVWSSQMDKAAEGFTRGVELLERAKKVAMGEIREKVAAQLSRAKAIEIHLASSAVQARFFSARNKYLKAASEEERNSCKREMLTACKEEKELIKRMLKIVSIDSEIAYESSNHYFYLPCDLGEAYLSILHAERWLQKKK
jgi:hypothetical protein